MSVLKAFMLPGVGVTTLRRVARSATPSLGLSPEGVEAFDGLLGRASMADLAAAYERAVRILEDCDRHGITPVTMVDSEYPKRLLGIDDYPPIVYVKGSVQALSATHVAVVGTRQVSEVGERYATRIARELAELGAGIVSGLALGVDTAAHAGALKAGGVTIAVLAHGLDSVSPKSNTELAERIVENGGALVSEHPPGIRPHRAEFVRRNRIQSGLSAASIIVESGEAGGAIHQARFTRSQGRGLYAFLPPDGAPGECSFERSGAELLVRELGAKVVSSSSDLRALWNAAVMSAGQS